MKKYITSMLLVFIGISCISAQTIPTGGDVMPVAQTGKYPFCIYKKIHDPALQNNMVSVLVKGDMESIPAEVRNLGGVVKFTAGDIACIKIPVNKIDVLAEKNFVQRIEGSDAKIEVLNDQMIINNKVDLVQQGVNLPQGYDGTGVVVGIIDEGIDITHKDFHDAQGNTRIKWLWDQRLGYDPNYTPMPYGYGQNFTNTQIDNNGAIGDAVIDHEYSHGTHVTGIAAGNGLAVNNYHGVAPKADIVFVAVNTSTSDDNFLTTLVDAVQYVFNKADSLNEPCSINISLGTYFGSHDGLDLQAQAISNLIAAKNGRFIACAAGNEGSAPIHLHTDVTPDSSFTWLGGYSTTQSLYCELWADSADIKNVQWMIGVDDTMPSNQYRGGTAFKFVTSKLGDDTASIYNGLNRIGKVETYVSYAFGRYSMECLITPDSAWYHWRFMTKGTGKFDAWSFDFVPGGLPDPANFPIILKYKAPDINQNIVSSFTCSPKVMTVGCYANRNFYSDVNNIMEWDTMPVNGGVKIVVGSLSSFSSHGPTRDGRIKPEITATGQWVLSCAARYDLNGPNGNNGLYTFAPNTIAAGGQHRLGTGTSMASPVVAGTAALYFQKNPNASYQEVKDAIISCTNTDQFTGSALPNNFWGYGKLNSYKALTGCNLAGIKEGDAYANILFENYPNPFSEHTTIHYDLSNIVSGGAGLNFRSSNAHITISDALGRKVRDIALNVQAGDIVINRNETGSGVYFYSLVLDGKIIRTNKLVVM